MLCFKAWNYKHRQWEMWKLRIMFSSSWIVPHLLFKDWKGCVRSLHLHLSALQTNMSEYYLNLFSKALQESLIDANDWISERLQIDTSLVNYPTITRLYKKHGSSTCDMNALIKLQCDCEIRPIYMQIWEQPSACVVQLTYGGQGMSQGEMCAGHNKMEFN